MRCVFLELHLQPLPQHTKSIHRPERTLSALRRIITNEPKATTATCVSISHDPCAYYVTKGSETADQVFIVPFVGKMENEEVGAGKGRVGRGRRGRGDAGDGSGERTVPLTGVGEGVPVVGTTFGYVLDIVDVLQFRDHWDESQSFLFSIRPSQLQVSLPNCMNIHISLRFYSGHGWSPQPQADERRSHMHSQDLHRSYFSLPSQTVTQITALHEVQNTA